MDVNLFAYPNDTSVMVLDCAKSFKSLTEKERLYAHHLSRASWIGGLIMLLQNSPESSLIFCMLMRLFGTQTIPSLKSLALDHCGFSEDEFKGLLVYTSAILSNLGNYKEFGAKFIPNISQDKLMRLIENSDAFAADSELMEYLWAKCGHPMFLRNKVNQLEFVDCGGTVYVSSNFPKEDATVINQFLGSKNIRATYMRVFKASDKSYEIRLASELIDDEEQISTRTYQHEGRTFRIIRGDYGPLLDLINKSLGKAQMHASNKHEVKMLTNYIDSFRTGSMDAHKRGTVLWVTDKHPSVEMFIGFGVNNRDSGEQRGEFESFVAVVNKEMSDKFHKLVENAELLLRLLPWPKTFENDEFTKPEFTSLDILTFAASSRMPVGMHISTHDRIRQNYVSKNFHLGNVVAWVAKKSQTLFTSVEDQELMNKYGLASTEIHVGLHELLGHGSGKLFRKNDEGYFNFDVKRVTNPITGRKIKSWYSDGETYDSVFLSLGPSYEECRAECVALLLSLDKFVLEILGYKDTEAEHVSYVFWLSMLLAGLCALGAYSPKGQFWALIHLQARFVILRVLLEAGKNLVTITEIKGSDGRPDLRLTLDPQKINSEGKLTISEFLLKLQVYKSTADVKSATAMYKNYSILKSGMPFLKYRNIVIARQKSSPMFFVLPNTRVTDKKVKLKRYKASHEGLIQSWIERYPSPLDLVSILKPLWEKEHEQNLYQSSQQ